MNKKDDLFELIKSMSGSERGYFKKFSSGFAKAQHKNYLRLYDALAAQETYNEDAFKKKFKKEKFVRHLSSERNYLYNLILRTLKLYHEGTSTDLFIQDALAKVELLFDRGLYAQARKLLKTAREKAVAHEKFHLHLEIIDWDHLLPGFDMMELAAERNEVVAKIGNHTRFQFLFKQLQLLREKYEIARTPDQLNEFNEIIEKVRALPMLSVMAETNHYFCSTNYLLCGKRDLEAACESQRKMISFMEENILISNERLDVYIIALGLMADILFQLKKNEEAFAYLDKLKALEPSSLKYQGNQFNAYYNRVLAYYNFIGDFKEAARLAEQVELGMERFHEQLGNFIMRYHFIFFHTWFGLGDFRKANTFLHKIINLVQSDQNQELDSITRLLVLVTSYESGDQDQLENRIVSTYRYLKKRNKLNNFEKLVLKFVRSLADVNGKNELHKLFIRTKEELQELFKDELERRVNVHFDFMAWLECKTGNISYADSVKRAYEKM